MTSTELITIGADSPYEVLQMSRPELNELLSEALSPGETLSASDLIRVKIPGAGGKRWEVPNPALGGEESMEELVGVPLRIATRRGFWHEKFSGGNESPDCASEEGIVGVARRMRPGPQPEPVKGKKPYDVPWETQECAGCPFNEFGSAIDDASQAKGCKEVRQVFLLQPESILPLVINVTPGSLAAFKAFRVGLLNMRLKPTDVEIGMALEKVQNAGGIDFARVVPRIVRRLDPDAAAAMKALAGVVAPQMDRAAADINRNDVEDATS